MTGPGRRTAALAAAAVLAATGCSGADGDRTELTVLAAASFTDVFETLAGDFERAHPGVDVRFSFGSSTTLAEQAVQGAPGDVLATADPTAMSVAAEGEALLAPPTAFATNRLVLVVPPGNPDRVRGPADLDGLAWVRCADDVPCGRLARSVLGDATASRAGSAADPGRPASLEVDVRAVLAKVVSGEADAGLVYASDAVAAGDRVDVVALAAAGDHRVTSTVAPLADGDDPGLARAWVALLRSGRGRTVLREAGFGPA